MGISGKIAKTFLTSQLTPLLAVFGLLLGVFAVIVTPKEEEPQINVTFANVFIAFPGATAREVEQMVSTPAEQVLAEIEGMKHVYSTSLPGRSILTAQFEVGEDRTQAIVRLYNAIYSNLDWLPQSLGVQQPIIKPMGIDDVPIVSLTLWSEDPQYTSYQLQHIAHTLEVELQRAPGTRDIYTIGGSDRVVHVVPRIENLSAYGITLAQLANALQAANQVSNQSSHTNNNRQIDIQLGEFFHNENDIASLIIGMHNGAPVYLRNVADVKFGHDIPGQFVSFGTGPANKQISSTKPHPAVTIAVAKKPGTNAVDIADQLIDRLEQIKGIFIPDAVNVSVTRNYGATAEQKANQLISKLIFATASVVLLVLFALGKREAVIVGVAVVITLAVTLFASWAYGFTINRVSLFALIFSIGILVDDAIVVVENIHRHMAMSNKSFLECIPIAVDEVGSPTILATFTVIAALLPMAFVSGLMGPYMSPIPINASMGMLISLAVAFVVTPWLAIKLLCRHHSGEDHSSEDRMTQKLTEFLNRFMTPFLGHEKGGKNRLLLAGAVLALIVFSVALPVFNAVVLKMLPFDNKSEIQVVVDMPEGTTVEQTQRVLSELAQHVKTVPEVTDYQSYAGTAAPINFNGLVRQYYLRTGSTVGDIQINLQDKSERDRQSHEIAVSLRQPLQEIGKRFNANVKIVEVPPGPPVLAPIVAEIYGLDYQGQRQLAGKIRKVFESTDDIVDIDDSIEYQTDKLIVSIDRSRASYLGVSQQQIVSTLQTALEGRDSTYLHSEQTKYPIPVRIEAHEGDKSDIDTLVNLKVTSNNGVLIALADVTNIKKAPRDYAIYHKDMLPVTYVFGDLAGALDSPLYGMFDIYSKIMQQADQLDQVEQSLFTPPEKAYLNTLKWDGEWQITFETFRDMGIAYGVGIILIYLLVVAQFKSYVVPIIIMIPIPLTIIGVLPGHALLGAQFTATSMIGMIALAGIIVRNSILLVDFINDQLNNGVDLQNAVIQSGAIRAKPIILTGLAAMMGAFFILDDPIFNGLAIALIFGVMVSTVLTLFIIPVLYYAYLSRKQAGHTQN